MKSIIVGVLFILIAVLALSNIRFVNAMTTSNVTVNITVLPLSQIIVVPDALNWTDVFPGYTGGIRNLTIKNTGSLNVTLMHAYVNTNETETTRPYQIDNPSLYSSGSMLLLRNESEVRFYWAQRKEWNWTTNIPNAFYETAFPGIGLAQPTARGFLRNASRDFVWAARNGSFGMCNDSDALFAIEDDEDAGTTSTRTPTVTNITRSGGDIEYSYFAISTRPGSPLNSMCVAVSTDCSYILTYKYDRRGSGAVGYQVCANSRYIRAQSLIPGDVDKMYADAWVPRGIPDGQLALAQLTIEAI